MWLDTAAAALYINDIDAMTHQTKGTKMKFNNVEVFVVKETLRNGGEVIKRRPRNGVERGTMAADIVLCFLPHNSVTPFATWQINVADGDTYWGHYFDDITEAEKDFEARGK